MFPSWWRRLAKLTGKIGTNARRGGKPRPNYRPEVERFEDRLVPTKLFLGAGPSGTRGSLVTLPIDVDALQSGGNTGLSSGSFVLFYDLNLLTYNSVAVGTANSGLSGISSLGGTGWNAAAATPNPGEVVISLSSTTPYTGTSGASLVNLTFQINSTDSFAGPPTTVDLAKDNTLAYPSGPSNATSITDDTGSSQYTLSPGPKNNSTFSGSPPAYFYGGASDGGDNSVTITGTNVAPVANPDSYTALESSTLAVPAPGVLANDTDSLGDPLTVASFTVGSTTYNPGTMVTLADNATLKVNGDGSFVYTPVAGTTPSDSFSYTATNVTDQQYDPLTASATVSLTVNDTLYVSKNWTQVAPTVPPTGTETGAVVKSATTDFGGTAVYAIYGQNAFGIISNDTSNAATVQDAITAAYSAPVGPTVLVGPGTYTENLSIPTVNGDPLTLDGANHGINAVTGTRGSESTIAGGFVVGY